MNIIFQTNIINGSLITKQGVVANNSGTSFKKTEKGEVVYLTNGNFISYGKLNNVKTIAFYIKSKTNTTIFSDDVTTKLQISSGSLSGQNNAIVDNVIINTISFNKWHFCIVEFNTPINFTDFRIKATNNYFIGDIICSNILFTNTEKQQLYINYLNLYSIAKPVIFNPNLNILKPSEVKENNIALIASYNHNPISNKDINVAFDNFYNSNNARTFNRTLTKVQSVKDGTLWTTQSTSTSLNYGNIQSLRYIIKPKVLNQTLCKLNSSSNVNITSGGGIDVTGISNEIIYINGSTTGIISINTWNTIIINLPTPINANAYVMGNLNYSGLINDEKICYNILTNQQIKNYHNQWTNKEAFFEDYTQYPIGQKPLGNNYQFKSGTWSIAEQTIGNNIQYYLGQKYVKCTSSGIIFAQQKNSYGTFYFNNILLLNDNDRIIFNTDRPELNRQNGYAIERLNSTTARLVKLINGVSASLMSNNILDLNNKLYDFMIQRKTDNTFSTYYKQSGQSKWILLNTNIIDSTFTTSNYLSLQFGTNSYMSGIKILQGIVV